MAWLQTDPSGNYHVSFRFGGRKFKRSLKTKSEHQANSRLHRLEENIRLVESGRLELPTEGDIPRFLLSDGKIAKKIKIKPTLVLTEAFDEYLESIPDGSLEGNTIKMLKIHRRHLERLMGAKFKLESLKQTDLQTYITKRAKEPGRRGRPLSAVTIRKEITTLRSLWYWAVSAEYLTGEYPNQRLKYPKTKEKPPFQTYDEIMAKIETGNLDEVEQLELWDCLFLSRDEIDELLKHVRKNALHDFIYPMFVMAAHTGARRSELIRSQLVDFGADFLTIREKKRRRGKYSTRRVPMSPTLAAAIKEWVEVHPGGSSTFCLTDIMYSSKTREHAMPITPSEADKHFNRVLLNSKWSVIPGWHCLRHSFCSNCAMKGIDQRLIDSWVGHMTEEMRKRYRHLFPSHETKSLELVFG